MDDRLKSLVIDNGVQEEVKGNEIKKEIRKEYSQDEVEAAILNTLELILDFISEDLDDETVEAHKQEIKALLEYRHKVKAEVKEKLNL